MSDIAFLSLFCSFPFLMWRLMSFGGESIFKIDIPNVLVLGLFLFSYIGILPLYFNWVEYEVESGVNSKDVIFKMLISSMVAIVCVIYGVIAAKSLSRFGTKRKLYPYKPLNRSEFNSSCGILIFVLLVLYLYLSTISDVALFASLSGATNDSKFIRSEMGNNFQGRYHWYDVIMHHVCYMVAFNVFASFLVQPNTRTRLLLISSFLIAAFTSLMAAEKSPFVALLLGFYFTYLIVKRDSVMPVRHLLIVAPAILVLFAVTFSIFSGVEDIETILLMVINRAFASSISPAYFYFEIFPRNIDFLYGLSLPNPGQIFPFESYRISVEVAEYVSPILLQLGIIGSMPAVFWAEAYANFGLPGIPIVSFFIGFVLKLLSTFIGGLENTSLKAGLLVTLIFRYQNLSNTGFSGYLADIYLIVVFLVFTLQFGISNRRITKLHR